MTIRPARSRTDENFATGVDRKPDTPEEELEPRLRAWA